MKNKIKPEEVLKYLYSTSFEKLRSADSTIWSKLPEEIKRYYINEEKEVTEILENGFPFQDYSLDEILANYNYFNHKGSYEKLQLTESIKESLEHYDEDIKYFDAHCKDIEAKFKKRIKFLRDIKKKLKHTKGIFIDILDELNSEKPIEKIVWLDDSDTLKMLYNFMSEVRMIIDCSFERFSKNFYISSGTGNGDDTDIKKSIFHYVDLNKRIKLYGNQSLIVVLITWLVYRGFIEDNKHFAVFERHFRPPNNKTKNFSFKGVYYNFKKKGKKTNNRDVEIILNLIPGLMNELCDRSKSKRKIKNKIIDNEKPN